MAETWCDVSCKMLACLNKEKLNVIIQFIKCTSQYSLIVTCCTVCKLYTVNQPHIGRLIEQAQEDIKKRVISVILQRKKDSEEINNSHTAVVNLKYPHTNIMRLLFLRGSCDTGGKNICPHTEN